MTIQTANNASNLGERAGKIKQLCLFTMLGLILTLPETALAAGTPWDNMLNTIIGFFNSTTSRLVAILMVIMLGFSAFFGRLTFASAGGVILGIILVFGSASVADLFINGV